MSPDKLQIQLIDVLPVIPNRKQKRLQFYFTVCPTKRVPGFFQLSPRPVIEPLADAVLRQAHLLRHCPQSDPARQPTFTFSIAALQLSLLEAAEDLESVGKVVFGGYANAGFTLSGGFWNDGGCDYAGDMGR